MNTKNGIITTKKDFIKSSIANKNPAVKMCTKQKTIVDSIKHLISVQKRFRHFSQ